MKNIISLLNQVPKHIKLMATIMLSAIVIPAALYAWGPSDRPTYTYEVPAGHVTFNSITNNPKVGDERNFVRIKEDSTTTTYVDNVNLEPGKVYQVMVYYHNNAASNLNETGIGIAKNATLRMEVPGVVKAGVKAAFTGTINSPSAKPIAVYDEAYGTNATGADIAIRYVSGSATVTSNGAVNGAKLPDSLFTTGTNLGYDKLDGTIPGCNKYAGYVVFKIRIDQPNFTIKKQVSVDAGKTWVDDSVKATAGSTVQYRIIYQNTGSTQQDNVSLRDTLPNGVSYIAGSSQIANSTTGGAYKSTVDGITTTGYNAGSYQPNGNVYFKYSAKIADNDSLPTCGDNNLVNTAKATTTSGAKEDTATVIVTKTCKTAAYTCDALSATKLTRTSVRLKTNYTVNNATFTGVTYVIKDTNGKTVDTKTSSVDNLDYTQGTTGKYTAEATISALADGKNVTATSEGCKTSFEITDEPFTPVTPPVTPVTPVNPTTPSELPTTGPGETLISVIGLGAIITSLGYYISSRRAL